MDKILIIVIALFSLTIKAQVGISFNPNFIPDASAALHLDSDKHTLQVPRVYLTSTEDIETIINPSVGLVVFNLEPTEDLVKGFYSWTGTLWQLFDSKKEVLEKLVYPTVSTSILGYNPVGVGLATPVEFTMDNITFKKVKCEKNEVNSHYYCAYRSVNKNNTNTVEPLNWNEAFSAAKEIKGYLVTITSEDEWNFIKSKFLQSSNSDFLKRRIWLGHNKVKYPGNPNEFLWITGESPDIDWVTGEYFSNFANGEPNNNSGIANNTNEGCSHIWHREHSSALKWNDTLCNLKNVAPTETPIYHIFEFNK